MRRISLISAVLAFLVLPFTHAWAWWDGGHMQIAYVAYASLDPQVQDKVDALLKRNKNYPK